MRFRDYITVTREDMPESPGAIRFRMEMKLKFCAAAGANDYEPGPTRIKIGELALQRCYVKIMATIYGPLRGEIQRLEKLTAVQTVGLPMTSKEIDELEDIIACMKVISEGDSEHEV